MVKNKHIRQTKKPRKDSSLLFILACSLLGGYLVFTSFAAQKPNTTKPGVISINALPKNGIYYRFPLSNQVRYCFESPQQFARFKIYDGQTLKESYDLTDACIIPKQNYNNPVISITGVSANSQLTIVKR